MSFVDAPALQVYRAARWKKCYNHSRFVYIFRRLEKLHLTITVRTFYSL